MKRILFIIFLIGYSTVCCAQKSELSKAYKNKDFSKIIEIRLEQLQLDSTDVDALLGVGKSYNSLNEFNLAIPYLLKAKEYATVDWQISWSLIDLMTSYYSIGKRAEAKECYNMALKATGTKNSESALKNLGLLFGFDQVYDKWKIVEKDNIRFHFQKTAAIDNIENYMKVREKAFLTINEFFAANMPKKIDFFVWKSNAEAMKVLHASLGFTKPQFCISHNRSNQTRGHEITHNISFWREKSGTGTKFINEGIGVYFDQTNNNRMLNAKQVAKKKPIDVKDLWLNGKKYSEEILYPVAGAWVGALVLFNKEKFLALSKNQTYQNALLIYGDELNSMIDEFNNRVNGVK